MSSETRPDISRGAKHLVDNFPCLSTVPDGCVLSREALSEPVAFGSVPVIDVGGLEDPTRRVRTVEEIARACEEWGFFVAINHGLDSSLMEMMLQLVTKFFELPFEEKMIHSSSDEACPVLYGSNLNSDIGMHARHWRDYLQHFGRPFNNNTCELWPTNPSEYRELTKTYLEEVWKLAMKLAGAISEGLGLYSNYMERVFGEGSQIVACNYYPKCPQPDLTLGVSAHTDRGGITILTENDVEGLQVRYRGEWVPVPHVAGSCLVNIGDCVEIMSNGKFKSVEHRAVVNKRRERITVAVGNGPGYDVVVEPISELINRASKGPSYEPILFKDIRFKDYSTAQKKE